MNVKYRGLDSFEDCIVYFHYVGLDMVGLLKRDQKDKKNLQEEEQSRASLESAPKKSQLDPHLTSADLLWFINIMLPKVLFNVIIPLEFFPENFLPYSGLNVDLLYRN